MKQLSRRARAARPGRHVALPFLDAMYPAFAAQTVKKPLAADSHGVPLRAERDRDGGLDAGRAGSGSTPLGELPRISSALAPYRNDLMMLSGLTSERRPRARRRPGRSRPRRRRVSHGRASEEDLRQGHQDRHLDGSGRGAAARRQDAVRVARARLRRGHSGRQLRQRL